MQCALKSGLGVSRASCVRSDARRRHSSSSFRSFSESDKAHLLKEVSDRTPCRALSVAHTTEQHLCPARLGRFITNAVKYAYPEGNGVIEVSVREIKRHLRVEVSDQGIGLPDGFAIDQPSASLGFKVIQAWCGSLMAT
jgi:hypothetical protein